MLFAMFRDKLPDIEDPVYEFDESPLEEGEDDYFWKDDDTDSCSSFATGLLQITTLAAVFLIGILFGFLWHGALDSRCSRHVSQYSPVMSDVGISYHLQEFNGSLLKENIYRQDASPEVDAAWNALGVNYRAVRVPPEEAEESGLAPDQVKIRDKYGGGFPANVQGLYHLHCLNILRQSLYYNYDYYHAKGQDAFANNDYIARRDVSRCLDIVRQQLMCTVDTGVLGHIWIYPENPEPFVDVSTRHKCKNFEQVRRWAEVNQLPENQPGDFLEPPAPGDHIYDGMP